MKATRRRKITFDLGNYEMYEVEAAIEYATADLTDAQADMVLDNMMAEDVNRAERATMRDPDDNDTSVYEFNKMIGGS